MEQAITATPAKTAVASILKSILKSSGSQIFSVQFVKKDDTIRNMQARLHVKKDRVHDGKVAPSTAHIPKYLTVYDVAFQNKRSGRIKKYSGLIQDAQGTVEEINEWTSKLAFWTKASPFRNVNCETIISMTVKGIRHQVTADNTLYIRGSEDFNKPDVIVGKG